MESQPGGVRHTPSHTAAYTFSLNRLLELLKFGGASEGLGDIPVVVAWVNSNDRPAGKKKNRPRARARCRGRRSPM